MWKTCTTSAAEGRTSTVSFTGASFTTRNTLLWSISSRADDRRASLPQEVESPWAAPEGRCIGSSNGIGWRDSGPSLKTVVWQHFIRGAADAIRSL